MKALFIFVAGIVIGVYLATSPHMPALPRLPKIDSDVFMIAGLSVILALTVASSWGRK